VAGLAVTARRWGWRHAGRRAWAVSELSLAIAPGERVLLLGASGAGKSTLLHALAGVLAADEGGESAGELLLDGRRPVDARGHVGLVLQDPDSQVVLARVGDDVAFGCENLGLPRAQIWQRVDKALAAVDLNLPLDQPTSTLSGGQKQRLALAGVLAMRPGLILLDEPTANLDPRGVLEVRDAVARSAETSGATLIVVEHRVDVWADFVDRVIVIGADGGLLADGPTQRVLTEQGERLAREGVWVPGYPPARPRRRGAARQNVLLRATGLSVGRRHGIPIASNIGLTVSSGRSTVISGANGSGKSTLALTLAGLIPPLAGELEASPALHRGAARGPIAWRSRELLTRIGTVFQDPEHQLLATTVRAELEIGPRALRLDAAEIAARVDSLLRRLRLESLAEANPFSLSGGEKRRLSVATILASQPQVLVLDEPTFGQDSRTWTELVALLAELLDEGRAVVSVTHDQHFVEALADDRVVLGV
jgi:energy-coupling factor transport system ATP-binding protein